jgi:hypothetical protein
LGTKSIVRNDSCVRQVQQIGGMRVSGGVAQ